MMTKLDEETKIFFTVVFLCVWAFYLIGFVMFGFHLIFWRMTIIIIPSSILWYKFANPWEKK